MPGGSNGTGARDLLCPPYPRLLGAAGTQGALGVARTLHALMGGQAVDGTGCWGNMGPSWHCKDSPLVHPSFCRPSDVGLGPGEAHLLFSSLVAHRGVSFIPRESWLQGKDLVLLCR